MSLKRVCTFGCKVIRLCISMPVCLVVRISIHENLKKDDKALAVQNTCICSISTFYNAESMYSNRFSASISTQP